MILPFQFSMHIEKLFANTFVFKWQLHAQVVSENAY